MSTQYKKAVRELEIYLDNPNANNFTALLYKLIAKADFKNIEKIRKGFPGEVKAFTKYMESANPQEFFN